MRLRPVANRAAVAVNLINTMQIENARPYRRAMVNLLKAENLPADDLPVDLDNFFVVLDHDKVIGSAGLEIYGNYGLLRSLAVHKSFRNNGIGDGLLAKVESIAKEKNLSGVYLLTETAPGYFNRKGYQQIDRANIPAEVQRSSEFSHVCPASAIAMKKELK